MTAIASPIRNDHPEQTLKRPSLLAVCYEFSPQVTPMANRTPEILNRLRANWNITIIAPKGSARVIGTRFVTIPVPETGKAHQLLERARLQKLGDWLPVSDRLEGWRRVAYAAALAEIKRDRPNLLLAFMYPYASGDVVRKLHERTRIPAVFNFDDTPSCDDMHPSYPSRIHFKRALAWEDAIVESAAAVIYVSQRNLEKVRERQPAYNKEKLHLVRCGVTDQLPPAAARHVQPGSPWTILYAGNMSGWVEFFDPPSRTPVLKKAFTAWNRLGRHTRVQLDLKGSTPHYLAHAMRRIGEQNPDLKNRFRFELIGNNYPSRIIERALRHANLTDLVSIHGPVPHAEVLRRLQSADALFLCLPGRPDGSPGGRISIKTYEYLATDRPILAALPPGENREYLQGQPGVWITEPDDVEAMAQALDEIGRGLESPPGLRFCRAGVMQNVGYDVLSHSLERILRDAIGVNAPSRRKLSPAGGLPWLNELRRPVSLKATGSEASATASEVNRRSHHGLPTLMPKRPTAMALCYEFPPQVTPMANRTGELLSRLSANWNVTIIAPHGKGPLADTRFITVAVPDTGKTRRLLEQVRLQKLGDWLPVSDRFEGWRQVAYAAALAEIERDRPDLLLSFIYPFASGDVALKLHQTTGIPVVFNFNDSPSCDDMHSVYASRLHFQRALAWEDRIVEAAAAVIYVSRRNLEKVRDRQTPSNKGKLHLVRAGVTDLLPSPAACNAEPGRPWTILYTGNMSGWMEFFHPPSRTPTLKKALAAWNRLGQHTRMAHDHKGSTPHYLVRAIRSLGAQRPALQGRFRFELIGNNYPLHIIEHALHYGEMADLVSISSAFPHDEVLRRLQSADVLFMCLPGRPDGSPGGRISAKTYEYLATDRPILAALPPGENREYLEGQPGVWITEPDDVKAMAQALGEIGAATEAAQGRVCFDRRDLMRHVGYAELARQFENVLRAAWNQNRPF